jgi:hypothetical protein
MKTYIILYAEDVPHYAHGEVEARGPKDAIARARKLDTETFTAYEPDWSGAVCRRIVSIEDPNGEVVAEAIPLDDFVLHNADVGMRLKLDAAEIRDRRQHVHDIARICAVWGAVNYTVGSFVWVPERIAEITHHADGSRSVAIDCKASIGCKQCDAEGAVALIPSNQACEICPIVWGPRRTWPPASQHSSASPPWLATKPLTKRATSKALSLSYCPHEGGDLAAGYIKDNHPRHNLAIDLNTGHSPCRSLPAIEILAAAQLGDTVAVAGPFREAVASS